MAECLRLLWMQTVIPLRKWPPYNLVVIQVRTGIHWYSLMSLLMPLPIMGMIAEKITMGRILPIKLVNGFPYLQYHQMVRLLPKLLLFVMTPIINQIRIHP